MRLRKLSLEQLVDNNKKELLNDKEAMKKLEEQIEIKRLINFQRDKLSI
ncbi:FbpB family small basic protein [Aquibacillus halophilus]|uniref:FbpB family small basic protein n=1 Tax=Aquibacillus halophilus TaxID=930132 RepID=A0A6A8DG76_9BACI|nr:FbpB family small basic protein [Aquibacillus halophilus]MRH41867.1 FbpB family small basic protein [Aquibacillus halophilus]